MCPACAGPVRIYTRVARCAPCAQRYSHTDLTWIDEETERRCLRCHQVQPIDRFVPYRGTKGTGSRERFCMQCQHYYRRENPRPSDQTGHISAPHREALDAWGLTAGAVQRLRKLGLTPEEYAAWCSWQENRCGVCGEPETRRNSGSDDAARLSVDHDHRTGYRRGIICSHCNHALGRARDSPRILRALADYLDEHAEAVRRLPAAERPSALAPVETLPPQPRPRREYDGAGRLRIERRVDANGKVSVGSDSIKVGREHRGVVVAGYVTDDDVELHAPDGVVVHRRTNSDLIIMVRASRPRRRRAAS